MGKDARIRVRTSRKFCKKAGSFYIFENNSSKSIDMRIQAIQHVPFETPGHIITICERAGHQMNIARVYLDEPLPDPSSYDLLLIMGGPMSIHDEDQYPWLVQEKQRVRETIGRDKPVIGFCLGAQIIADVLGAQVFKAPIPGDRMVSGNKNGTRVHAGVPSRHHYSISLAR